MKTWMSEREAIKATHRLYEKGIQVLLIKHPRNNKLYKPILPGERGYRKAPYTIVETARFISR